MSVRAAAVCIALLAHACDTRSDAGLDAATSAHQAITGGTTDSGDPAVVALVDSAGTERCSGTLVAPKAILTAGHCSGVTGDAVFGDTAGASRRIAIASVITHPKYSGEGQGYDVAIMHLVSGVIDIAPVPVAAQPLPANAVGMTVRHVGFGVTDDSTGAGRGTKRQVSYPITELDPLLFWSGAPNKQTCDGDSGGPGMVVLGGTEQIVGLVSGGPACPAPGNDARVDVADIRAWIASNAPLPPPPTDAGSNPDLSTTYDLGPADLATGADDAATEGGASDAGAGGKHHRGCSAVPHSTEPAPGWLIALLLAVLVRSRRRAVYSRLPTSVIQSSRRA
jgi:uncharacterized protein (TIGR03382 family)